MTILKNLTSRSITTLRDYLEEIIIEYDPDRGDDGEYFIEEMAVHPGNALNLENALGELLADLDDVEAERGYLTLPVEARYA